MSRLCVCVPTYNRRSVIEKFIVSVIDILKKKEIDLYICDSSTNDDVKQGTEEFIKQGYRNLFYKHYDSMLASNEKVFKIFEEVSKTKYDFVWLIHDHTVFTQNAVDCILQALEKNFDFYTLHMQAGGYDIEEFTGLEDFLYKCAWRLNSFGASIINIHTFLKDVDWDFISKKYNDSKTLNYSHIGFYFEQAVRMTNFKGCQVYFDRKDFIDFLRSESISWGKETMRICLECWGNVIFKLPDVYTNKLATLRTQDRWFLSKYSLLVYKKNKNYGIKEFIKYGKWIRKIYPKDYMRDFAIAVLPYRIANQFVNKKLYKRINEAELVYIFGAGRHAVECANYLKELGLNYNGFVVSSLNGNPQELLGHKVDEAEKVLRGKKSLVIIAVLSSGVQSVKDIIGQIASCDNTEITEFEFE